MTAHGDRLVRLIDEKRILSQAESEGIAHRVMNAVQGGGDTRITIISWWTGELRWARNRVSLASDRRDITVAVGRTIHGADGISMTNQLDDESIAATVRAAERAARFGLPTPDDLRVPTPQFEFPTTTIWSDASFKQSAQARAQAAVSLIGPAESAGMLSAGYVAVRGESQSLFLPGRAPLHAEITGAQCSMTVRDQHGTGSGWAGLSSYDLAQVDAPALAKRALEKCLASRNPVALEPGRYTVILEPQAVSDLVSGMVALGLDRIAPEKMGSGPFVAGYDGALKMWRSKLGLKVVDERITISHDPSDPALGVVPFDERGEPFRAVKWIDRGVLAVLSDYRNYALESRNDDQGYPNSGSYRMSGGDTSIEDMIASTKRGLLVTRLSNISALDGGSLLLTGITRDGLWLIENGKITKAVKNLRFTESPLFVLNSIEQLGTPTPVFSPNAPVIVPPLKARDFSFTSMIDAV
jgi:predicted Zn-dependent protease